MTPTRGLASPRARSTFRCLMCRQRMSTPTARSSRWFTSLGSRNKRRYKFMLKRLASTQWWIVGATTILLVLALCWVLLAQSGPPGNVRLIARGAGITIEGGTGSPDFIPVRTQVAFHAEIVDGAVIGNFECLALAPAAG